MRWKLRRLNFRFFFFLCLWKCSSDISYYEYLQMCPSQLLLNSEYESVVPQARRPGDLCSCTVRVSSSKAEILFFSIYDMYVFK